MQTLPGECLPPLCRGDPAVPVVWCAPLRGIPLSLPWQCLDNHKASAFRVGVGQTQVQNACVSGDRESHLTQVGLCIYKVRVLQGLMDAGCARDTHRVPGEILPAAAGPWEVCTSDKMVGVAAAGREARADQRVCSQLCTFPSAGKGPLSPIRVSTD